MSIAEDFPVASTPTDMEFFQAVFEQDQAIYVDYSDGNECAEENPATNAEKSDPSMLDMFRKETRFSALQTEGSRFETRFLERSTVYTGLKSVKSVEIQLSSRC
ncbi:hypothetical protein AVEN_271558-1 [Araneus ventricosus]|uniref:Uncharacterized protein n=1 Tax=Araneus ventricosus TaxID=182803 RepID=A0A4Y2M5H7_ARAVE|nr:hypothetical protein AVEN_271558-1 [Araneus ventricosus]